MKIYIYFSLTSIFDTSYSSEFHFLTMWTIIPYLFLCRVLWSPKTTTSSANSSPSTTPSRSSGNANDTAHVSTTTTTTTKRKTKTSTSIVISTSGATASAWNPCQTLDRNFRKRLQNPRCPRALVSRPTALRNTSSPASIIVIGIGKKTSPSNVIGRPPMGAPGRWSSSTSQRSALGARKWRRLTEGPVPLPVCITCMKTWNRMILGFICKVPILTLIMRYLCDNGLPFTIEDLAVLCRIFF